jgi:hypothetical protein
MVDKNRIDRNLFMYLTKRAGKSMQDVADAWKVPLSGVYKRLTGEVEIRRGEMESWMLLVGVGDAGPVFFPAVVAHAQQPALPTAASLIGANGA